MVSRIPSPCGDGSSSEAELVALRDMVEAMGAMLDQALTAVAMSTARHRVSLRELAALSSRVAALEAARDELRVDLEVLEVSFAELVQRLQGARGGGQA